MVTIIWTGRRKWSFVGLVKFLNPFSKLKKILILKSEESVQNHQIKTCEYCNISKILTMGSEPVISSLNRANPFHRVCLFCISVRNRIYVIEIAILRLVVMARNLYFL